MYKSNKSYPTLSKPPIKSAIFEIRYLWLDEGKDASTFSDLSKFFARDFPYAQKGEHTDINLAENPDQSIQSTITKKYIRDCRFVSQNRKVILLASRERFNLNISDYYSGWDEWFNKFKSYWSHFYDGILKTNGLPIVVTGVSIRYINTIELEGVQNINEYFKTTIYADEGVIPDTVQSFFTNYRSITPDKVNINVTQGLQPSDNKSFPYLFDIDIVQNNLFNNDIWDVFLSLRDHKNDVFFSNLTEKTLNLLLQ